MATAALIAFISHTELRVGPSWTQFTSWHKSMCVGTSVCYRSAARTAWNAMFMLTAVAVLQWAGIRQCLNSNQCGLATQSTTGTALLFLSGHSVICFCHSVSVFHSPQVILQKQKVEEQPFVSNLIMQEPGHWQTLQNEPSAQRATKPRITTVLLRSSSFLGQSSLYFLCKVRRLTVTGEEGIDKQCSKIISPFARHAQIVLHHSSWVGYVQVCLKAKKQPLPVMCVSSYMYILIPPEMRQVYTHAVQSFISFNILGPKRDQRSLIFESLELPLQYIFTLLLALEQLCLMAYG